ncbi:hypothetical protein GSS88_01950 [Corynebacterium sp. 3HC-13]|uniref:hypothetical protein n=1 Tax=Corynebacterium poyangense TaxID=2684405 RepID=UPI001CCF2B23|nr:hypothetical protein [Corynebacterium poyangense]MBZ8176562.1 hypothetical protein [Corynebacterium poyangense]
MNLIHYHPHLRHLLSLIPLHRPTVGAESISIEHFPKTSAALADTLELLDRQLAQISTSLSHHHNQVQHFCSQLEAEDSATAQALGGHHE